MILKVAIKKLRAKELEYHEFENLEQMLQYCWDFNKMDYAIRIEKPHIIDKTTGWKLSTDLDYYLEI